MYDDTLEAQADEYRQKRLETIGTKEPARGTAVIKGSAPGKAQGRRVSFMDQAKEAAAEAEKSEKTDKAKKSEKGAKAGKEKAEKASKVEKSKKAEKAEKAEKTEKED